jgi:hypothetical protein
MLIKFDGDEITSLYTNDMGIHFWQPLGHKQADHVYGYINAAEASQQHVIRQPCWAIR